MNDNKKDEDSEELRLITDSRKIEEFLNAMLPTIKIKLKHSPETSSAN